MSLSKRVKSITPSTTLAIEAKAKQLKDVISFGAGEPDFDTPANIKEAAKAALDAGFTKYTPAAGTLDLKKAVCEKFKADNNLDYQPENIVISCGAKHSIYNAILALVDPGDEIIIPSPYWVSYPEMVKLADGIPKYLKADENTEFKISAAQLKKFLTKKTKMLILNSPCNPTGSVYNEKELREIAEVCLENKVWILSDEIYEKIIYDGVRHVSVASFSLAVKNLTVVVNGVSKTYAMTGWRIGYLAAPVDVASKISALQSHSTSNPTSFAQVASVEALRGPQESVVKMVAEFDKRRKYMVERLNAMKNVSCLAPKGAFYTFPNISKTGKSSDELANYLIDNYKVAVVPGSGFGAEGFIRLSYATSMEKIKEGLDRIEKGVL